MFALTSVVASELPAWLQGIVDVLSAYVLPVLNTLVITVIPILTPYVISRVSSKFGDLSSMLTVKMADIQSRNESKMADIRESVNNLADIPTQISKLIQPISQQVQVLQDEITIVVENSRVPSDVKTRLKGITDNVKKANEEYNDTLTKQSVQIADLTAQVKALTDKMLAGEKEKDGNSADSSAADDDRSWNK